MRRLAIVLALIVGAAVPCAADAVVPAGTISFDRTAIPPPDSTAGKAVARVLNEYIYTRSEMPAEKLGAALRRLIVPRIFDAYAAQHRITVTDTEIAELLRKLNMPPSPRDGARDVARSTILQWKVNAALYAAYGGKVVEQQGVPMEPVGAWASLFETLENSGAIEFFDAAGREQFYRYYRDKSLPAVAESRVDFKTPWWKR